MEAPIATWTEDLIARATHEVTRAFCDAVGDPSLPEWDAAEAWMQASAVSGVRHAIRNPMVGAAENHEHWLADKLATGWKWGPQKDTEAKEHPCMVPWDALPVIQRAKNVLFLTVVRAMSAPQAAIGLMSTAPPKEGSPT